MVRCQLKRTEAETSGFKVSVWSSLGIACLLSLSLKELFLLGELSQMMKPFTFSAALHSRVGIPEEMCPCSQSEVKYASKLPACHRLSFKCRPF